MRIMRYGRSDSAASDAVPLADAGTGQPGSLVPFKSGYLAEASEGI